jgi:hypothetical protein
LTEGGEIVIFFGPDVGGDRDAVALPAWPAGFVLSHPYLVSIEWVFVRLMLC